MTWTIEAALNDDAIKKSEKTNEGYSFWLNGIDTEISVILSVNPLRGGYNFHLSHYINTPSQISAYIPSRPWGDDEAYALHLAITAITQYYNQSLKDGESPSSDWLMPSSK